MINELNRLKIIKRDDQKVVELLQNGEVDYIETVSNIAPADDILLFSIESGILGEISNLFPDKRSDTKEVPIAVLIAASIISRLNMVHSIEKTPYLLQDANVISRLGYNFLEIKNGISNKGYKENKLFVGSTIRKILDRHFVNRDMCGNRIETEKDGIELINWYNSLAHVYYSKLNYTPTVHILDCTKLDIASKNTNYENANWTSEKKDAPMFGYKLATLRGVLDNAGVIEEIALSGIKESDITLGSFVLESKYLKHGDILVEDKGFLDGETISKLKLEKGVDVFIPAKKNMHIYKEALKIAKKENKWTNHPTRNTQEISLVRDLEGFWESITPGVKLHGAVVREKATSTGEYEYYVFLTTQNVRYAKTIINTYQIRPEIEEDFRHLKPVWGLRNFTSTKYVNVIFHIIMVLMSYNLFKVFTNTKQGERIGTKTLRRIYIENKRQKDNKILVYSGDWFAFIPSKDLLIALLRVPEDKKEKLACIIDRIF